MPTKPTTIVDTTPLIKVRDLQTFFYTDDGVVKAVDGISFEIFRREVFGLVGESGCGKSVTALSILRLIDSPGKILDGSIEFDNNSLLGLDTKELIKLRGDRISMIFQQPHSSLNPVMTLGLQVAEVFQIHKGMDKQHAWDQAVNLLKLVGIPDAAKKASAYPHEISGGQAQRVMIALALALDPDLLIADEPTTALDVTIQAQILDLIRDLIQRSETAVLLITHDLGVIAEMADRVAVMYAGHAVEQAPVQELFDVPLHPYTQGLIKSIPVLRRVRDRLETIPGSVPNLIDLPQLCRFADRCSARLEYNLQICVHQEPNMFEARSDHYVRCWLYENAIDHQAPLADKVSAPDLP